MSVHVHVPVVSLMAMCLSNDFYIPPQLDDVWGDLLQQYQMMLYESIGYYGNAIKEMEDMGGRLSCYVINTHAQCILATTRLHIISIGLW